MKNLFTVFSLLFFLTLTASAQDNTRANTVYSGTAQPFISTTSPLGGQTGKTVTMTIEGSNLSGATEIIWNKPGINSKIIFNTESMRDEPKLAPGATGQLVIDKLTRNKLTIETTISAEAPAGVYNFRVKAPMGTTNLGSLFVSGFDIHKEHEMNDSVADAEEIKLPASIHGKLEKPGDFDHFKFTATKNQTIVFQVNAASIGSRLDSVLSLLDASGKVLATNDSGTGGLDSLLGYTFFEAGDFFIRVSEFESQKPVMSGLSYILSIAEAPYLASVFPLGVRLNQATELEASGFGLGENRKFSIIGKPTMVGEDSMLINAKTSKGESINAIRVAVGIDPEAPENAAPHDSIASAQVLTIPSTINGTIQNPKIKTGETDFYKFTAKKDQTIIFEVGAQRFGSLLDSVIEIFDEQGRPVPRAVIRAELETQLNLRDADSGGSGIRIVSWNGINPGDYMMAGNEILMVDRLPKGPDEDMFFVADPLTGNRVGMIETTPEGHAINSPIYKATIHPPGTKFSSNGLPTVTLNYRNDDGGAMYGKDSKLTFKAPANGTYFLSLRDVRDFQGYNFGYRLSAHEPRPDFSIVADLMNPNVPVNAARPITITANRKDGFDGDIDVKLSELPIGWSATSGKILAGQTSTVMILSANEKAVGGFPLKINGTAKINQKIVTRAVSTEEKLSYVSTAPAPELNVFTDVQKLTVEPGGKTSMTVSIKRNHGFAGRVPIDVRGLPHGIITTDVGLNGILITPEETSINFTIEVQPWVKPGIQPFYVVARIETTSPQRQDFAYSQPILLTIKPKEQAAVK